MSLYVWTTHYKSSYIFARDCCLIQAPLVLLLHSFDDLYCMCCRCVAECLVRSVLHSMQLY
ncbi:hypothetical protein BDR03DRAFT_963362 [Suillus americanus]|nr:hypothetical protein BDR03DRAFT_963362 [Suillus americanus]